MLSSRLKPNRYLALRSRNTYTKPTESF